MQLNLPKDPVMLLSAVNMKLRDFYHNLDQFCEDLDVDKKWLTETLEKIDYYYDEDKNQFI